MLAIQKPSTVSYTLLLAISTSQRPITSCSLPLPEAVALSRTSISFVGAAAIYPFGYRHPRRS